MKVPAFWSLGTLLAVIFIGKSWVRAAYMYPLPEHHDRPLEALCGPWRGHSVSFLCNELAEIFTKLLLLDSPYPCVWLHVTILEQKQWQQIFVKFDTGEGHSGFPSRLIFC